MVIFKNYRLVEAGFEVKPEDKTKGEMTPMEKQTLLKYIDEPLIKYVTKKEREKLLTSESDIVAKYAELILGRCDKRYYLAIRRRLNKTLDIIENNVNETCKILGASYACAQAGLKWYYFYFGSFRLYKLLVFLDFQTVPWSRFRNIVGNLWLTTLRGWWTVIYTYVTTIYAIVKYTPGA